MIDNIEISLGRRPVKIGADGVPTYVYRAEAANTAIKMAGSKVGLFKDRAEVAHPMDFEDFTDEELLLKLRDEADALLLENRQREARGLGLDANALGLRAGGNANADKNKHAAMKPDGCAKTRYRQADIWSTRTCKPGTTTAAMEEPSK
jgi:hypothetical protein